MERKRERERLSRKKNKILRNGFSLGVVIQTMIIIVFAGATTRSDWECFFLRSSSCPSTLRPYIIYADCMQLVINQSGFNAFHCMWRWLPACLHLQVFGCMALYFGLLNMRSALVCFSHTHERTRNGDKQQEKQVEKKQHLKLTNHYK